MTLHHLSPAVGVAERMIVYTHLGSQQLPKAKRMPPALNVQEGG